MKLNNAQYDLNAVIAVAATGPNVEIDAAELDMENYPTLSRPVQTKLPVFFKYNGKFIVLLGQELVVAALMAEKTKIKGKLFTISLGAPTETVYVADDKLLPDNLVYIKREPNKAEIKAQLKSGAELEGCALVQGKARLTIK